MDCDDTAFFIRRGCCGPGWPKSLIWLDIVSDAAIFLSYMLISAALIWFLVTRRESIRFRVIWGLFGSFIFMCGLTHASDVMVFYYPNYWLDGWIRAITAVVSLATVATLGFLMRRIVALPTVDDLRRMVASQDARK